MTPRNAHLDAIEKRMIVAYVLLAALAVFAFGARGFASVLAGGLFAHANFRLLRILIGRALLDPNHPKPGVLALLPVKLLAIGAALLLIVRSGWVDMPAFAVGVGSLIVAILSAIVVPGEKPGEAGAPGNAVAGDHAVAGGAK
ncbi:ATP synthase subunit I [bacterium]|nr:ATP synthase subunit I [bacterium]